MDVDSFFFAYTGSIFDFTRQNVKNKTLANKTDARKQKQIGLAAGPSFSRQTMLGTILKSKVIRESFVLENMHHF